MSFAEPLQSRSTSSRLCYLGTQSIAQVFLQEIQHLKEMKDMEF